MRKLASIAVFGALLVSISACSTPVSTFAACDAEGSADLVSADGAFGADPEATFPTPLVSSEPAISEIIHGDGDSVPRGGVVDGTISIYLGETGEALVNGGPITALPIMLPTSDFLFPFTDALQCATDGSRVVTTGTAEDLFGTESAANLQLDPEAPLVVVTDVTASYLGRANGVDQLSQPGMPAIVLAPSGQPGFTFPDADAPTDLRIAVLKQGSGATVTKGDSVVLQYSGILWGADELFDSSWKNNGTPVVLTAESLEDSPSGGIVPGFATALIGQKVGSQVLAVIPPEFGYPAGSAPESIPEGSTMVFVFDVLGIQ